MRVTTRIQANSDSECFFDILLCYTRLLCYVYRKISVRSDGCQEHNFAEELKNITIKGRDQSPLQQN